MRVSQLHRFPSLLVRNDEACVGNVAHLAAELVDLLVQDNLDSFVFLLCLVQNLLHLGYSLRWGLRLVLCSDAAVHEDSYDY